MRFEFGGGGAGGGMGGFSDFFESIFGGGGRGFSFAGSPGMEDMFGGQGQHARSGGGRSRPAQALTAELTVSLEDIYHGATKQLSLNIVEQNPDGSTSAKPRSISVKIPPGTIEGSSIRLAEGTTGKGKGGGDLLLKVHIAPHPKFVVSEFDLTTTVQITPWEAALGAKIEVPTIDGSIMLSIPAGCQSGKKFRLKEKGLPKRPSGRGDLFIKAHVAVPTQLSSDEHELFEKLGKVSSFNPRQ
jgi:curved DNA-binding protein